MQSDAFNRALTRRAQRQKLSGMIFLLAGLVLIALGILLLLFIFVPFTGELPQVIIVLGDFAIGIIAVLVGLFRLTRGIATPTTDALGARLTQTLSPVLDEHHLLMRHVKPRGLPITPDALIVGPGGVMLLKLIDEPGIFRCEGDVWLLRRAGRDFSSWERNPSREMIQEIDAMGAFLAQKGLEGVPISAVIVFTHRSAEISTRAPAIPITTLEYLPIELRRGFLLSARIDTGTLKKTRRTLL